MTKRRVDITDWSRRKKFEFFIDMINPIFSVTARVDLDNCYQAAKGRGRSLFLYYSYAIIKAINEIEELRLRANREAGEVVVNLYDEVDLVAPIAINKEGDFTEVRIKYNPDFEAFYQAAEQITASVTLDMDPIVEHLPDATYAVVSALPTIDFTAVTPTLIAHGGVEQVPLINVGKMSIVDGRRSIPIAIAVHHGFVDGYHLGLLFDEVQKTLNSY